MREVVKLVDWEAGVDKTWVKGEWEENIKFLKN